MPDWARIAKGIAAFPVRRPVAASLTGAGAGALAAGALAPEERKRPSALMGAGLGAAAGLVHPGIRRALANAIRRQVFAYTGKAPKTFKGTTQQYLKSIQKAKVQDPQVTLGQRAWEKARRAVGRPAKELKPVDQWKEIQERHTAGMLDIPSRLRLLRMDPKEYARRWWKHGGKKELMWAPAWAGLTAATTRGQAPEEKRKAWGETVGGTLGWMATSGLPASVWLPATYATGYLGKLVAGGGKSAKPKQPEMIAARGARKAISGATP